MEFHLPRPDDAVIAYSRENLIRQLARELDAIQDGHTKHLERLKTAAPR